MENDVSETAQIQTRLWLSMGLNPSSVLVHLGVLDITLDFERPDLDPCTVSMTINGLDPRLGYEAHRIIWVILNKIILTYN